MKNILTIARKELLDILRDRRTLLIMVIVPLLLFPLIINLTATLTKDRMEKSAQKTLKVAVEVEDRESTLLSYLEKATNMQVQVVGEIPNPPELIRTDSLDAVIRIPANFQEKMESMGTAEIEFFYQAIDDDQIKQRVLAPIEKFEEETRKARLSALEVSPTVIRPLRIQERNVATQQEIFGKIAGGFLPYIFILFCFFGCFYPAIDLFSGEKERGTLETILTLPVKRLHILFGKMGVVALSGFVSAMLALTGLVISLQLIKGLPEEIFTFMAKIVEWESILMLLALIIPIAIFFAGILIPIASQAKSFKEAQSKITPLNFLVIVPAAIGLLPGFELNVGTALIPILNVALATKEIIAGTIDYGLYLLVFLSLILLAVGSIYLSVRGFSKEGNILN